jgi:hypothetical protein
MTDEATLADQLPEFGRRLTIVGKMLYVVHSSLEHIWNKMSHWNDREEPTIPERELGDLIARAAREGARRAAVEIQTYNEGGNGNGSSPSWRNWVMTMLGTLIVLGVASLIVMYANQKTMEARMDSFEHRLDNLERKIFRGGEP